MTSSDFEVSTEFFLDPFAICYSEQGCSKRTAEEAVISIGMSMSLTVRVSDIVYRPTCAHKLFYS